ncbi:MAG: nuclear transport factor 2 family protein [Thermoanaerobaculia bacterium]
MSSVSESTVRAFIVRINSHDPGAIVALCTSDHVFTDSLGNRIKGRAALLPAWQGYFSLFPNYRVAVSHILAVGPVVGVFGTASATLANVPGTSHSSWSIPAAWRAVVKGRLISEWQVYADNKPVADLLDRRKA